MTSSMSMQRFLLLALALSACEPSASPELRPGGPGPSTTPATATTTVATPHQALPVRTVPPPPQPPDTSAYPWHDDPSIEPLEATDDLFARFAPPPGFRRVPVETRSFGDWLRHLPLAEPSTPVLDYAGGTVLPGDHRHLAAVTTLDVGDRDLQQCADAVMRLHAEWRWWRGEADRVSYGSGFGPIPWTRFRRGEQPAYDGKRVQWAASKPAPDTHRAFRRYLDVVFSWSNTGALERQGSPVSPEALRPGDFFVLPGNPGHTVLVLDLATNAEGQRVALVGQSFMPAQRFQVLRPAGDLAWFTLDDEGLKTPFWRTFPWSSLRRLDG